MQDSIFNLLTEEQLRGRNTLKWNYFGPDVVPLWLAEMDFPTAPAVLDGVRACVDNEEFGYPPLGEDSLPRATADWCRQRYGWCPRPDWVRVVPDVLKGMEVVVEFLTRPESPVALPVPAYMPFFDVLHVTGRQRVEVPMVQQDSGRYLLDLDALQAAFVRGAGSVIICNPNNPLGTAFTEAELRAIVDIAARHGARVIADEIWVPVVYGSRHVAAASVSEAAAEVVPDGTYLSWVDFRALALPSEPAEYLLSKAKVALSPGIPFGAAVGSGFARLNFATTRAILDRAIEAIAAALRDIID